MRDSPRVSVVLPTYNRADWLPGSIGSAIGQTYEDWELIVWDDGSKDATEDLVKSFGDQRIRYFREENRGASYARNRALERASGEYVAFLDSDDTWTPDKLTRQVAVLSHHPSIDLVFGDFTNANLASGEAGLGFTQTREGLKRLTTVPLDGAARQIFGGMPESLLVSNFIATDSVVVKRAALSEVGQFNEALRNCEDLEYWWRMGVSGITFGYIDAILLNRNKPTDSLSSPSPVNYQNCLAALDCCREEALKRGRADLLIPLNAACRNVWLGLARQYNMRELRRDSITAIMESGKYGIELDSFKLLAEALWGYRFSRRIKDLVSTRKHARRAAVGE